MAAKWSLLFVRPLTCWQPTHRPHLCPTHPMVFFIGAGISLYTAETSSTAYTISGERQLRQQVLKRSSISTFMASLVQKAISAFLRDRLLQPCCTFAFEPVLLFLPDLPPQISGWNISSGQNFQLDHALRLSNPYSCGELTSGLDRPYESAGVTP